MISSTQNKDFPWISTRSRLQVGSLRAGKARGPQPAVGWPRNLPHHGGCAENKAGRWWQVPTIVNSSGSTKNCLKEFPTANEAPR